MRAPANQTLWESLPAVTTILSDWGLLQLSQEINTHRDDLLACRGSRVGHGPSNGLKNGNFLRWSTRRITRSPDKTFLFLTCNVACVPSSVFCCLIPNACPT